MKEINHLYLNHRKTVQPYGQTKKSAIPDKDLYPFFPYCMMSNVYSLFDQRAWT